MIVDVIICKLVELIVLYRESRKTKPVKILYLGLPIVPTLSLIQINTFIFLSLFYDSPSLSNAIFLRRFLKTLDLSSSQCLLPSPFVLHTLRRSLPSTASITPPFSNILRRRLLYLDFRQQPTGPPSQSLVPMEEDHSHSPAVSQYAAQLYCSTFQSKSTMVNPSTLPPSTLHPSTPHPSIGQVNNGEPVHSSTAQLLTTSQQW
ncbi:hypothetical protein Bca4012_010854 [Brassica carinata]